MNEITYTEIRESEFEIWDSEILSPGARRRARFYQVRPSIGKRGGARSEKPGEIETAESREEAGDINKSKGQRREDGKRFRM
ncbi:hypothetical protein K0M31_009148 [Melipona bicolor]|uniref:Uncharacterized protein n=1 Tax=Melipona bicolor TaxID=60889 RepID=A0AA40FPM9_9HYME|nr:hypothetical protein K0M31_009148 [Melipona bicolor]